MLRADVAEAAAARPSGVVSLLPAFDQYVVAAPRDDSPVLAAAHKDRVYRRQGWLSPVLLVDGRIAGVWRHEAKHGEVNVVIEPFGAVGDDVRAGAEARGGAAGGLPRRRARAQLGVVRLRQAARPRAERAARAS